MRLFERKVNKKMRNLQKYLSYILIEGYFNIVSTHNDILKCEFYIKIPKQLVMPRVYKQGAMPPHSACYV